MAAPRFPLLSVDTLTHRRIVTILAAILVAAFAARIGARLYFGEAYFWTNSYFYLYELAQGVARGAGFCQAAGCERPPLYLSFLALTTLAGKSYLPIVIPQALMGAGTALLAFLIGRRLFTPASGLLAAAGAAFYPYYVMHDTALQDTAMVTFVMALSVWLLVRAAQEDRARDWLMAGIALGALVLVRAAMAPSVAAVLLWALVWGTRGPLVARLRTTLFLAAACMLTATPWLAYTHRATGAPVLTTDSGYLLWQGNNAGVFSYYPAESIDRSALAAIAGLPLEEQAELNRLSGDAAAISDRHRQRAIAFMRADPWRTVHYAARKLDAAFSWTFNPYRGALAQWVYAASYIPVALLGITGMVLARRRPETALIAMLYLAFIGVSAVFFAHTSHRSYLDIYWIVFAASVLVGVRASARR
ncbi:MAG: glycosyltransferase family 39 protein [Pseudolabrys sp.]|nr:glycosyltransferase family 39 protein [Pseudolabrys sp.]MDP2295282.1 glycosyltransferase family 39 protein [Pseudolabrys sp.]